MHQRIGRHISACATILACVTLGCVLVYCNLNPSVASKKGRFRVFFWPIQAEIWYGTKLGVVMNGTGAAKIFGSPLGLISFFKEVICRYIPMNKKYLISIYL